MRKTNIQIKVRDVKVPINSVLLETSYFCANCGNLMESKHLAQRKYGSTCPLCESRSIYPIARWLSGKRVTKG
jgi:DNA-directed RNA polymerase subunit RPC12/RpoP